jgi:hypothetical protein
MAEELPDCVRLIYRCYGIFLILCMSTMFTYHSTGISLVECGFHEASEFRMAAKGTWIASHSLSYFPSFGYQFQSTVLQDTSRPEAFCGPCYLHPLNHRDPVSGGTRQRKSYIFWLEPGTQWWYTQPVLGQKNVVILSSSQVYQLWIAGSEHTLYSIELYRECALLTQRDCVGLQLTNSAIVLTPCLQRVMPVLRKPYISLHSYLYPRLTWTMLTKCWMPIPSPH